jgi:hypothetical protein
MSEKVRERRRQEAAQRTRTARIVRVLAGPGTRERRLISEERAWATGAEGEQKLAEALSRRCPHVLLLHDRRMPASRANIDHLAFAPSGVYVIDAKRCKGKIAVETPLLGAPRLCIAGRDRTSLIDGLERQVEVVTSLLGELDSDVKVHGCLCFIAPEGPFGDVGLPLMRTLRIRGIPLYYTRRLTRQLHKDGPVTPEQARQLHDALAAMLPPAG